MVGWDGLGVLLPGVGNPIGDVVSMSRIDDIAAAHGTTQANHMMDVSNQIDANDSDGVSCRSENGSLGLSASSPIPKSAPQLSSGGFVFVFVAVVCSGCRRVFVFCFPVAV